MAFTKEEIAGADLPLWNELVDMIVAWEDACDPDVGELAWRIVSRVRDGWRPIEEALKDGTYIDLWIDGERYPDCWWRNGQWWSAYGEGMDGAAILDAPSYFRLPPDPPSQHMSGEWR